MSFRKRNVIPQSQLHAGLRPSPIDGRVVTSTGCASLDALLAGHGGIPVGCSLLIEENGNTDYAGALLKYFAAQGIIHDHAVIVFGLPSNWGRDLPGIVEGEQTTAETQKMKIAWRYEGLGDFAQRKAFSHDFDLTKRLDGPSKAVFISAQLGFQGLLDHLSKQDRQRPCRLILPSLLSPALYPLSLSRPDQLVAFFRAIRRYNVTAMVTLPASLHPRSRGHIRWIEHLVDGVLELNPFPHAEADDKKPQGLVKIRKLPIYHERGGTVDARVLEDLAFTVSRKRFDIQPFNLPPADGDVEAQTSDMQF